MTPSQMPLHTLVPAGKALLLLSTGFGVIQALRGAARLEQVFFGLAIGILGLEFYTAYFKALLGLSGGLEMEIKSLGKSEYLKEVVWQSIQSAGLESDSTIGKLGALAEQVFRTGVWGVMSSIGDLLYLLAETVLEVKRDVLLHLVQFLFPLIWSVYPFRPSYGHSLLILGLEMSLWGPCLALVKVILGYTVPTYLTQKHSLGVPLVAVEIIAALMILDIPGMVRRLFSGSLQLGGERSLIGFAMSGPKALRAAQRLGRGFKGAQPTEGSQ